MTIQHPIGPSRPGGMFRRFDANEDQRLEADEIAKFAETLAAKRGQPVSAEELAAFDANGDGTITRQELRVATGRNGRLSGMERPDRSPGEPQRRGPRIEELFARFDDGDGTLTREELESAAVQMASRISEVTGKVVPADEILARIEARLEKRGLDIDAGIAEDQMANTRRRPRRGPPPHTSESFLAQFDIGSTMFTPADLDQLASEFASKISHFTGQNVSTGQVLAVLNAYMVEQVG